MAERPQDNWPLDLKIFGGICALWSLSLVARAFFHERLGIDVPPLQAVIGGVKFFGPQAQIVLLAEAAIFWLIGIGLISQRR